MRARQPGRRAFLRMGAGCALPLLAGGLGVSREAGAAPAADGSPADSVLDHIRDEMVRTYHGMRGGTGIRGEHIRSLAVNLDLLGVCLQSRRGAARADDWIRQRVQDRGREATAQELVRAYGELAAGISLQHGVVSRGGRDVHGAALAVDTLAERGIVATVRGHKAALNRLAALADRAEVSRGGRATLLAVRQKPGDDFLGYPPGSVFDGLTWCQFLEALAGSLGMSAAILALIGDAPAAAALSVVVEVIELILLAACKQDAQA